MEHHRLKANRQPEEAPGATVVLDEQAAQQRELHDEAAGHAGQSDESSEQPEEAAAAKLKLVAPDEGQEASEHQNQQSRNYRC